jgi:hypothetical protein
VREGFLALAQAEPDRIQVFDSTRPLEAVRREIGVLTRQRFMRELHG